MAPPATASMLEWLKKVEGVAGIDKLEVSSVGGLEANGGNDLGVFAREGIEAGGLIAKLPQALVISAEKAKGSELGGFCLEVDETIADRWILLLWLMDGRANSEHPMHTYLVSLPSESPTPVAWPPPLRAMLAGTSLGVTVEEERKKLEAQHALLLPRLCSARPELFKKGFGLEEFLWAHGMWYSRRYPTALSSHGKAKDYSYSYCTADEMDDESDGEGTMMPFLDLLNHEGGAQLEWKADAESVTFRVSGREGVASGCQVFNTYGDHANEHLMEGYGFAILDNIYDTYSLYLTVQARVEGKIKGKGRKLRKAAKRLGPFLLRRADPRWEQFPVKLWQALADPSTEEVEEAAELRFEIQPESVKACLIALQQHLRPFTETKTRDRHFATGGAAEGQEVDPRIRHIARYRDGQRQVLEEAIAKLETLIPKEGAGEGSS